MPPTMNTGYTGDTGLAAVRDRTKTEYAKGNIRIASQPKPVLEFGFG